MRRLHQRSPLLFRFLYLVFLDLVCPKFKTYSIVLVEANGDANIQSDALLRMGRLLGGPVGLVLFPGVIVPKVWDMRVLLSALFISRESDKFDRVRPVEEGVSVEQW